MQREKNIIGFLKLQNIPLKKITTEKYIILRVEKKLTTKYYIHYIVLRVEISNKTKNT